MTRATATAMSLRRALAIGSVVLTVTSLAVCGALIWSTTELRHINERTSWNLESVRLAEEAKIDLLLLAGSPSSAVRQNVEDDLVSKLAESRGYVITERGRRALDTADHEVHAYLDRSHEQGTGQPLSTDAAYAAVDELVSIHSQQTAEAFEQVRFWDRAADILGFTVGGILIVIVGGFVGWLQRRGVRPIFAIGDAMTRFGKGQRDARAPERGPAEIREMAERFNDMAAALGSQREAQMTFLAGVAHDLKNPLSILKMSVALYPLDGTSSPEIVRETSQRVRRQIVRLERMIDDLLDVTRIEAGKLEMKFEVQDATRLIRQSVDLFEGVSPEHRLELAVPERPVSLSCDPLRIEQVMTNLISNAIKYSPKGSRIAVTLEHNGSDAIISVIDEGVGISRDDQRRLFEPFRRLGLSKEAVRGVGLGLFVVKRIVEAHRGRIEVDSEPGHGSTFRVFLPAQPEAAVRPSTADEHAPA
jgi:two-component system sensor histidine kinase MtrB